ncbi:uncharacterized protein EI90DRAFT_2902879 [Cantharellus anzutake]|uniref:uncharacterized protein n=1 Tax=Cantharellus anzutake TaxID=1750568 RepID=UPI0019061AFA|nr:uncharacterized protein EI90DRAFT_2902879 [Cantharellus anzutake]KAF8342841.1 hypothetical protein EI90DRAFT_2902879 [Cantharellus anzutake]
MSTLQPSVIASNGAKTRLKTLKDCVIYVDVRTDDGSDAGQLFINMLKGLGARILTRLTPSITHVVFKSGSPTTLGKHKLYDEPKPFLVGIGWVVECVERRERADESRFLVDEPGPVVMERVRLLVCSCGMIVLTGSQRRKSMQPKMVIESALGAGLIPPSPPRPLVSTMEVDFFPSRSALSDGDVTIVASSSSPVIVQGTSQCLLRYF